jgi:hypothetical protein
MKQSASKIAIKVLIIIGFWIGINSVFYINDLPIDGEKKIGLPYPVLRSYIDRSNMEVYRFDWDVHNLIWDIVFVLVITLFYFFLFTKRRYV